ncbi:hypothetical protein KC19_2G077700 [Ceratodon purpureus]|uniref:Sister chromatid cohesion protein DCC1 n=1 Tax=Ceratodon purpureus TaxID=3225 RepID=A0A8T0ISY1_CERPU|nr:hypothetical protein KC19_2G077700 [Ceratodon purpureus]
MAELLELEVDGSTTVVYADGFGMDEFKLLEVDESILKELLHDGLTIKGVKTDEAVLCTSSTTYAIKYVSTSNTVLLIPPQQTARLPGNMDSSADEKSCVEQVNAGVVATAAGLIELVETAPRLDEMKTLLNQRPFTEDLDEEQMLEEDDRGRAGLYSMEDLVSRVQASYGQIKSALETMQAVEIDGFWRIVDVKFMQGLLEVILLSAVQHDWNLKSLEETEVVQTVRNDGYSPVIIKHCLACYGNEVERNVDEPDMKRWELDERKVCLHYAKQLLRAASKWRLEDFVDAWKNNIPTGLQPELEMLKGEFLIEKIGGDSWLRLYSVSTLPSKPAERFSALFKEKPKWEWNDLEPYLRGMRAPGQSVEAMLLRYTRKSQASSDVPAIYTSR